MVVATEELSWGSLGVGGSLITRPEILTRALVYGGTEEQKKHWLPKLATAEVLAAVAVTEPDFGSDVAGIVTVGDAGRGRLAHQRRQDLVHVRRPRPTCSCCWPAPTPTGRSRIAAFHVRGREARAATATGFVFTQEGGRTAGRPAGPGGSRADPSTPSATAACTPTSWPSRTGSCPRPTSSAGEDGLGKGFYLQMQGFENGRLQTAARAARRHAGGLRGRGCLRRRAHGVRLAHRRLPADPGQARPHGGRSSRPPASARTTWPG